MVETVDRKYLTKIFKSQGKYFTAVYVVSHGRELNPHVTEGIAVDLNRHFDLVNYITEDVSLCFRWQHMKERYRAYLEMSTFLNGTIHHEELGVGYGESLDGAFSSLEEVMNEQLNQTEERGKTI